MRPQACLVFVAAAVLSGCAVVNPLIRDYNIVPLDQEIEAGRQMHEQILTEMTVSDDPLLNQRVSRVGERLVSELPAKDYDYRFYVIDENSPNAFAIPGGRIYVHSGLLTFAGSEDELAGVIGHEIGHVYEKHPAKAVSRAYGLQALSNLIFKGSDSQWKDLTMKIVSGGVLSKYGRDDEREADEIGYYLTSRAGYSADGLLRFLRKLQRVAGTSAMPAFLQSHPPTPERIARLEELQAGAPPNISGFGAPAGSGKSEV